MAATAKPLRGTRVTVPQAMAGTSTTVGHLTDPATGNVYPILVSPSTATTHPSFLQPGTRPVTGPKPTLTTAASLPPTATSSMSGGTKLVNGAPNPGPTCSTCAAMGPAFPVVLILGGLGVALLLLYLAGHRA